MQNNRQGMGVPQTLWAPDSPVACQQNIERALLQLPIFFINHNRNEGRLYIFINLSTFVSQLVFCLCAWYTVQQMCAILRNFLIVSLRCATLQEHVGLFKVWYPTA